MFSVKRSSGNNNNNIRFVQLFIVWSCISTTIVHIGCLNFQQILGIDGFVLFPTDVGVFVRRKNQRIWNVNNNVGRFGKYQHSSCELSSCNNINSCNDIEYNNVSNNKFSNDSDVITTNLTNVIHDKHQYDSFPMKENENHHTLHWNPSRRDFLQSTSSILACSSSILATSFTQQQNCYAAITEDWKQQQQQFRKKTTTTTPVEKSSSTTVTAVSDYYNPAIPYSSVRKYKALTLPSNGLDVLLVSDKLAYRSSCALSINNAGQFADPDSLPGLAHLMEHMILSYKSQATSGTRGVMGSMIGKQKQEDFEDWIGKVEGASNAFTAYQNVCFHFSLPGPSSNSAIGGGCDPVLLQEALDRFANLFVQGNVESICQDSDVLKREIRRVDSELDFKDPNRQIEHLTKAFINIEHPYSRFSAGNLISLETEPKKNKIDVSKSLIDFFKNRYLPEQTVVVVVSSHDLSTLERWISPFGNTLSQQQQQQGNKPKKVKIPQYPGRFLYGSRYKHMVMYNNMNQPDYEKIIFEWTFDFNYRDAIERGKQTTTGSQMGFILSQIFCRRGPGSLYMFLSRRGWVQNGFNGIPKVSLPIDTSGFQLFRLEINLSLEGFRNRSRIVTAFYDCIETMRKGNSYVISRTLLTQYASMALLFGNKLAPRPPDAIELTADSLLYSTRTVASGQWYRFPDPDDIVGLASLQKALSTTLSKMKDPDSTVIIAIGGNKALFPVSGLTENIAFPSSVSSSNKWLQEPVSGARFYFDDMVPRRTQIENLLLSNIVNAAELSAPTFNALVPTLLRPARLTTASLQSPYVNVNDNLVVRTATNVKERDADTISTLFSVRSSAASETQKIPLNGNWMFLVPTTPGQIGLQLPKAPPEPTCRCAFVVQLLSSRPARANVRQAARAELWKLLFEMQGGVELAELGAPGGLSYDISFNKFGIRLAFLGPSQTLPSYTRRMTRRFIDYTNSLQSGSRMVPSSITSNAVAVATRYPGVSTGRRKMIISNLRSSTAYDVAGEGIDFLHSISGAVSFAQGDLLYNEATSLLSDIQLIFEESIMSKNTTTSTPSSAVPSIDDLLYKPTWKPRYGSACSIPGVPLISDACGRVAR